MEQFTLEIQPQGVTEFAWPAPLGTQMLLSVMVDPATEQWRTFSGTVRADFQGWRLPRVWTRKLPDGALAKIEVFRSSALMGLSVEQVAEGRVVYLPEVPSAPA